MDPWVAREAQDAGARAERELEALVAVSSPSGDRRAAEEAAAIMSALVPAEARIRRVPCSTPGHAEDFEARLSGSGTRRLLLLGHLDTVVPHPTHRPLERDGGRLFGSGAVDMKGGVVLALGVLRALARAPQLYSEAALLVVVDEEWRTAPFAHGPRFAGWDACLCFEAGELGPHGEEAVVVRRKAAGTVRVTAHGVSAHSGSAPDHGRNALLALAVAAQRVAELHAPHGPARLTVVPTILRSGEAFNVVPADGELFCDVRADALAALEAVPAAVPGESGGARLEADLVRLWPGMDSRLQTAALLTAAGKRLGRPVVGAERGGASDASHFAGSIPLTVDGLGPRGGGAHTPQEFVYAAALRERSQVALALVAALLDG